MSLLGDNVYEFSYRRSTSKACNLLRLRRDGGNLHIAHQQTHTVTVQHIVLVREQERKF